MSIAHEGRFLRDAAAACLHDPYWRTGHHFTGHGKSLVLSIERLLPRLTRAIEQAEGDGSPWVAELQSLAVELTDSRLQLVAEYGRI